LLFDPLPSPRAALISPVHGPQVQLVDGVSLVNLRCLQSGTRWSARVRPHFINTRRTMHQWVQRTPA